MKKVLAFVLAIAMMATFVACGAKEEQEATPEGTDGVTTITFMAQSGAPQCMYDLIEQFEAADTDIKVKVNEVSANDTYDQLVLTSQAGNPPDVYMTFWTIAAASNGLAADLSEFINMDDFTSRFTTAAQGYGEWDGKIYAIPYRSGCSMVLANKTMFDEAGIELPYDGWTWDEYYEIAKQLTDTKKGTYGFSICGDSSDSGLAWQFWPFLLQAGGQIIDETTHTAAFNSQAGVDALDYICKMINEGIIPAGIASTNVDQQAELVCSGKVAMMQDGAWFLSTLQGKAGENFEIVALPMPTGVTSGSIAGGTALGIAEGSQNKEAAWRFVEFMTSDDSLNYWCEQWGQISPLYERGTSEYYQQQDYVTCSAQLADEGTIVANHYVDSDNLNNIIANYIQAVYMGQMGAQEALDAAAEEWNAVLTEYYE